MSIAQQQLVEIAKALSLNARLIIMDEPTSSLTLTETNRLLELVCELSEQGVSIVYISHRLGEIDECADRVVVLRDGKNAGELTHERILARQAREPDGRARNQKFLRPVRRAENAGLFQSPQRLVVAASRQNAFRSTRRAGKFSALPDWSARDVRKWRRRLSGLENSPRKEIILDGKNLSISTPRDAIDHGIYLVPENRRTEGLVVEMTVRENISLPSLENFSSFGLINRAHERKIAAEQVSSLKVKTPGIETRVLNLSGGNQQKVVLGKWLAMTPKVMILDEPTRGIDVGAKAEIYRLMRELADGGAVILMISSDMEEILNVSDRIAVMHEGEISGVLERADCKEENVMQLAVGKKIPAAKPAFAN